MLELFSRHYRIDDGDDQPFPWPADPNDALYHVPFCFQLNMIALHMKQLQVLSIAACQQRTLEAVLGGTLLPNLRRLQLYAHTKHAHAA